MDPKCNGIIITTFNTTYIRNYYDFQYYIFQKLPIDVHFSRSKDVAIFSN